MIEFLTHFQADYTGILLTLLLLTIEHYSLWEIKLPLVVRYTLGVGSIGAGLSLTAGMQGWTLYLLEFWANVVCAGLLVGALHGLRWWRGQRPADVEDAFRAGAIARRALGELHGAPRKPDARDN